ncbi:MAG: LUD domain-containing protein [Hyphomicrobiales bacterium]|nr:LUD domain-containing protein [Hyphomicrobiales bacterium]MDE2116123.1 lactate utilization protein [Hyphomicrobiales bacterium]
MSSRSDIFSNIRRSLGVTGTERPRLSAVAERLAQAPKGVPVARGQLPKDDMIGLFCAQAEAVQCTVSRVADSQQVPEEIANYLRNKNLPATLRMGEDARLSAMPWSKTTLALSQGRSDGADLNAVSHAFAGVAETGTLIMTSGADNPTSLNFLPDNHIIVVEAADITGDYESAWQSLRERFGKGLMPRTVNMITGPSRSGDIEQTILLGAHGPRALHLVVVG